MGNDRSIFTNTVVSVVHIPPIPLLELILLCLLDLADSSIHPMAENFDHDWPFVYSVVIWILVDAVGQTADSPKPLLSWPVESACNGFTAYSDVPVSQPCTPPGLLHRIFRTLGFHFYYKVSYPSSYVKFEVFWGTFP